MHTEQQSLQRKPPLISVALDLAATLVKAGGPKAICGMSNFTQLSNNTAVSWWGHHQFYFSFDISWRAKDCTLDEALWQQELNKNDHPIDPVMSRSHSVRMLHRQKLPAALIQVAQVSLCRSAVTVLTEGSEIAIKMYFNGIRMIWSTYLAHGNIISNR